MTETAFIYSEALSSFNYGDNHPFKPVRARNTMELCNRHGLLYGAGVTRPEPAPAEGRTLELFHTEEYLAKLRRLSSGEHDLEILKAGLGTSDCPPIPEVYEFCLGAVGATMLAVDLVEAGAVGRAFNLVGGFHHAFAERAEGFCYINDVCIAILSLLQKGKRVAFIDIDAHHCNGVSSCFFDSDQCLVISLHEYAEGFYPGTGDYREIGAGIGRGFNVNIPLSPKTDDEVYTEAFERIAPPLIEAFKPDIVIAEIGADTLISDPLTDLRLTGNGYEQVLKSICAFSPALVCLGGGGYDIYRTARCWTLALSAMTGIEAEDEFAGLVGGRMYGGEIGGLRDMKILTEGPDKKIALDRARKAADYITENVFPILGAGKP